MTLLRTLLPLGLLSFATGCISYVERFEPEVIPLEVVTDVSDLEAPYRQAVADLVDAAGHEDPDTAIPEALEVAGSRLEARDPVLGGYLRTCSTMWQEGSTNGLERAWVGTRSGPLIVLVTPDLPSEDENEEQMSGVSTRSLELGLRSVEEHRWIDFYLENLPEFERTLPGPASGRSATVHPRDVLLVGDLSLRTGVLSGNVALSARVPREVALRPRMDRTFLFWKNLIRERWFVHRIQPAAERILADEHVPLVTPRAHLSFYVTRFSTYQLGPQKVTGSEGALSMQERFQDLLAPLNIAKADLLGVLALEWLIGRGMLDRETSRENLTMLVVMSVRALADAFSGDAPSAHAPASLLTLNYLGSKRAIRFDGETGKLHLDFDRMRAAVRELAGRILTLHAEGDREGATALFQKHGQMTAEAEALRLAVAEILPVDYEPTWKVTGLE